ILDESAPNGTGFLAGVCAQWEASTAIAARAGIRVVNARIGQVLDPRGGVLGTLKRVYGLGMGGRVGPGTQYVPWIALDDVVGMLHHALLERSVSGPMNTTGPSPVPQREFAATLGDVLNRP